MTNRENLLNGRFSVYYLWWIFSIVWCIFNQPDIDWF